MARLKPTKAPSRFEGVFNGHAEFAANRKKNNRATSFTKACYVRLFPPVSPKRGKMHACSAPYGRQSQAQGDHYRRRDEGQKEGLSLIHI